MKAVKRAQPIADGTNHHVYALFKRTNCRYVRVETNGLLKLEKRVCIFSVT